jgi:transglutaminase-like putative cysteine protease
MTVKESGMAMVRLKFSIRLAYDIVDSTSDFIFNIHAAQTRCQSIVTEQLTLSQPVTPVVFTEPGGNRVMRLQALRGPLKVSYEATVDIAHRAAAPDHLFETKISALPPEALVYLYPSRYCQSDRLNRFAMREFGHMTPGYQRVVAIQRWVQSHVTFQSGSSNGTTSAIDTLTERVGVCRDFAHLMIALCRALNIPARFVSGIDYGADPALGPTDFHAYVEVMLSGQWYVLDPSGVSPPMGLIRIGTGRDAGDTAFATIFGTVNSYAPLIAIEAIADEEKGLVTPVHCNEVLSTADCSA